MNEPAKSRQSALCATIYLLSFLPLANVLRQHFGFPLDDSWIHQVVARNLAQFHVLGFPPGSLSSGSTSLVWTVILAVNSAFFPSLSPVVYCALVSGIFFAGIGFSIKRLTEEDGLVGSASWSFALAPVLSGNFLWFGLIGMEHLLFILLSLAVVGVWFRRAAGPSAVDRFFLFGLAFLLVLTRPEGVFLVVLVLAAWRLAGRRGKDMLVVAAGAASGMAISYAMNWKISGQLAPPTMKGRQFLFSRGMNLHSRIYFLGQSIVRITKTWSIQPPQRFLHGAWFALAVSVSLIFAFLISFGLYRLWGLRARRLLFLCAWAGVVELLYFCILPGTGHGGRYIAVPLMLSFCLIFFGLQEVLAKVSSNSRLVWVGVGVVAMLSVVDSYSIWIRATAADIDQINSEHGEMAEWLQQNLPASVFAQRQLAAFDIGRIGYQFHGNVVDLGALVDSHFLPYLVAGRAAVYLQQRGVRYVVIPTGPDDTGFAEILALDQQHGVTLSLMHSVCADAAVSELAINSSGTAYPCQRLYSIEYGELR